MKKEMAEEIIIDAFKAGDYPQGKFTTKELSEIQTTYNPENYEAPILIGHLSDPSYTGKSTIPAYGWIGKVKLVGDHLKLVASQFSEQLKQFIKEGFYKKVSAAFFQPDDPNNPTPGKWHLHHLAFLGGATPAVKGLEQIAFAQFKSLGVEFAEMETEVSIDGEIMDEMKGMGAEDTMNDMAECCGNYLKKVEEAFAAEVEPEKQKGRISLAAYDLQGELTACMTEHFAFMEKMDGMEDQMDPMDTAEMAEKKSWLIKMAGKFQSIIHKRKETEMEKQKEQEFQTQIDILKAEKVALDTQVKEFTEKERLATEVKAKADADALAAKAKADSDAKVLEVKTFCDQRITEGKMTPAMREKDEPLMVTLIGTPEALKSFQEKYTVSVVPLGETKVEQQQDLGDKRSQVIKNAEKYVKDHPKEFVGFAATDAINRAVYLHSMGRIKFESK